MRTIILTLCVAGLCACGSAEEDAEEAPAEPSSGQEQLPPPPASADREDLTAEECEGRGGTVVGDIGDGAIHRAEYRCADGQEPIATVHVGVEGSVCCPASQCPEGGAPPVAGPDGIPENCPVLFEGCCYTDTERACEVAGCEPACPIMESYPGQLRRCDADAP